MGEDVLGSDRSVFDQMVLYSNFEVKPVTLMSWGALCEPQALPGLECAEVTGPFLWVPWLIKGTLQKENETVMALKHGTWNMISLISFAF